ncbi:MAG: hypothetical protein OHK0021_11320 [Bryobacter sp.]
MKSLLLLCFPLLLLSQSRPPIPEQAKRGKELFLRSTRGTPCAECHRLDGAGKAVGPDLTRIAKFVGPQGLVMSIQMTETAYMQTVVWKGRQIPAIVQRQSASEVEFWDLSALPVERKVPLAEVKEIRTSAKWTHPPTSASYTKPELADLIAYLRYAASGDTKPVQPSDFQTQP